MAERSVAPLKARCTCADGLGVFEKHNYVEVAPYASRKKGFAELPARYRCVKCEVVYVAEDLLAVRTSHE